jgi:hypothetical protein
VPLCGVRDPHAAVPIVVPPQFAATGAQAEVAQRAAVTGFLEGL